MRVHEAKLRNTVRARRWDLSEGDRWPVGCVSRLCPVDDREMLGYDEKR